MDYKDKQFLDLLNKSNKIVFLTGAGVSTHSGIPDYRSANGIYSDNPEYMLSINCWNKEYLKFLQFITSHFDLKDFEPNDIHKWIVELEKTKDVTVITQNIDNLHQKAGSANVIPYHGNVNEWECTGCFESYDFEYVKENNYCKKCGNKLSPKVVLYGQNIDKQNSENAIKSLLEADLIIVIGTSLAVFPFADLLTVNPLANKVLINKTETANFYHAFDLVFLEDDLDFIKRIENNET
jgi:NAD-dependent deacetylase